MQHGPVRLNENTWRFAVWAPSEATVALECKGQAPLAMERRDGGWFTRDACVPEQTRYRFCLADGLTIPDPASRAQDGDVHGWSVLIDLAAYPWKSTNWCGRPWHEAVILEVHAGALGGFRRLIAQLPAITALGFTAVELMPIADFPGGRNWGYDGVLPFAPDEAYGTPDDLRALVDAAHEAGLMMFLDVVYNHFGPDGAYIHRIAQPFFDEGVHTPWGAAIDFKQEAVRQFFISNALMWLNEYRFDGLRFDAVHAISPPEFLTHLAKEIRAGAERNVHLVLEHEGNRASLLRSSPADLGFDAQWADDFHHCLHVLLTGEREGYYDAFQNPAVQLARALSEGFVYQGETPPGADMPRGEPSAHLPPTAFVTCLQNHDQIGNRAFGERLKSLADTESLLAATAVLLLAPFIPLVFMGDECGSTSPFLYFTDHHEELAQLVRDGRRREFAHFAAFKDEALRDKIPDPNALETFTASIPKPGEDQSTVRHLYQTLLALRARYVTPGIMGCRSLGAQATSDKSVCARWALGNGSELTITANFGPSPVAQIKSVGPLIFSSRSGDPGVGDLPANTTRVYCGIEQ